MPERMIIEGEGWFNRENLMALKYHVTARVERLEQDHRVKLSELRGRIKQLDDLIIQLDIANTGEDTTNLPPNDTDTFKE